MAQSADQKKLSTGTKSVGPVLTEQMLKEKGIIRDGFGARNGADNCADATPVIEGTFDWDTAAATPDGTGSCFFSPSPDVWFRYTPTTTARTTIQTCGLTAIDTTLVVYASCGGAELGCSDDACGLQSSVAFDAVAGTPVLVRVARFGGGVGAGQVRISQSGGNGGNDNCADAIALTSGVSVNFDTTSATNDGTATCGASATSPDVWYRYTATANGLLTVSACGSSYDTVLSALDSCGGAQIACNDDSCGLQSQLQFGVSRGQTVLIRVAGFFGGTGSGTLVANLESGSAPANDTCANAQAVSNGTFPFDIRFASNDGSASCSFTNGNDIWYRYTATITGRATFSTCGSAFDSVVSVYGSCGGAELACNAFASCGAAVATLDMTQGQTVLVRVGAESSIGTGTLDISIRPVVAPPNDSCSNAIAVGEGDFAFDTTFASNDGTATCGASATSPDVWYRYTPTANGRATFALCGSGFDTVLSVLDGCGGNQLVCNDDFCGLQSTASTIVSAGVPVLVRVAGFNNQVGVGNLNISLEACETPANDNCANATVLTPGTPVSFITSCAGSESTAASCSFGGAPVTGDVWFRYTATRTGLGTVGTCGSSFDTVVTVLDGCGGAELACNDDACGIQSSVCFNITAGTTYLIQVAGWNAASGAGEVSITESDGGNMTPPDGARQENEDCGTDANGGCNNPNPAEAVTPIELGDAYVGNAWASGGTRDTDWYEFTITEAETITYTGRAEFALRLFVLDNACPPAILATTVATCPGVDSEIVIDLEAGTYRLFAGLDGFDGLPCGGENNTYIIGLNFNGGGPACIADFNNDGFVDFFDFNDFDTCFNGGQCPAGRTADVNNDGFVDFFDFNDFVDAFELGCN